MNTKICFLFISLFVFASCQKVINVNLNNANANLVIEGVLYDGVHDFKVKISKTSSYFGTEPSAMVSNAQVFLVPNGSAPIPVPLFANGEYVLSNFQANTATSYQLNVNVDGKVYSANAYMPPITNLDSLTYELFTGFGGMGSNEKNYLMKAHLNDTVGTENYYRIITTKNDTLLNKAGDHYLFDDKIRDGQKIDAPLFTTFFKDGDTADIQLLSMDADVYDYLTTLNEIISSNANTSAAPANPNSNFDNGALGYFAAYSVSRKSIRIKP